jgi:hypothetical protein
MNIYNFHKIYTTIGIIFILFFSIYTFYLFYITKQYKEGFLNSYCQTHTNCQDCTKASGCSWCPAANICLSSTSLKSTDKKCNQSNTIQSSFLCKSVLDSTKMPNITDTSHNIIYDFTLYKDRIANKLSPPNTFMTDTLGYSNEDTISSMNNVRNSIQNLHTELPGIITSSVENGIKPMVKGILSENYYIQGFQDMNTCSKITSCSACVSNKECGWNPRNMSCDTRGPNKSWYITQPTRCVTTPSTLGLMITSPN